MCVREVECVCLRVRERESLTDCLCVCKRGREIVGVYK